MPNTQAAPPAEAQTDDEAQALQDTPELRKKIAAVGTRVAKLRADRTAINADIQSELESLEALGIPKDAMKRALKDVDADEVQRAQGDLAWEICRAAMGAPVQQDAFAPGSAATH